MLTRLSHTTSFFSGYWITMRPYLLFISGITGMCGLSYSASLPFFSEFLLFAVFFFSYGFGQALTDCFQMDTDSLSSPYRPLVQGTLRKKDVMVVSLLGLAACGIILGIFSFANLFLAFFCVVGLSTYTYFKKRWWGGPWYNSWIVVLVFLMGFQSGSTLSFDQYRLEFYCTITTVFFGYANFVLTGYFKDVEADRSTGYHTLVVEHGRKISSNVSNVFALLFTLSGIVSVILVLKGRSIDISSVAAITLLIVAVYFSWYSQYKLRHVTDDQHAYLAILPCIHSYITMIASITIVNKPSWMIFLLIYYALYFLTIKLRPEQSQI